MRKKLLVNTMLIAMTAGVILTGCGESKSDKKSEGSSTSVATAGELAGDNNKSGDESDMADSISVIDEEKVKEIYKNAKNISIEKVIRTVTENEDGSSETSYDTYVLSEVNLANGNNTTEDYSATIGDNSEFQEDNIKQLDFKNTFGTDTAGKDGWDIYENILENNGFECRFDNGTYDQEIKDTTGMDVYVVSEVDSTDVNEKSDDNISDSKVITQLLAGQGYDTITSSKICFQTEVNEDGIALPDIFTAEVQYTKGTQTITRNMYIQIAVNE